MTEELPENIVMTIKSPKGTIALRSDAYYFTRRCETMKGGFRYLSDIHCKAIRNFMKWSNAK